AGVRDHRQARAGRAVQCPQLPRPADERGARVRGAPDTKWRDAWRDRRAGHGGGAAGARQRDLRGHRETDPEAAPRFGSQAMTEIMTGTPAAVTVSLLTRMLVEAFEGP